MDIGQTLIERYTLTARLGKGAMGIVYRALDRQTGQEVAVKVIARELALNHDMLERFRREGEALRQLRHPNIVGFIDMFELEEQYVIVMEYVPGGNLHALLKEGPLPLDRTRRMALELCDALTRAHHLNIIHRDLKPENIMLAADGTPKLTDFGVARLLSEGTRLTGTGTQVGTPFYMSPEAWEGKPLDAQTDIWSLGIMLYEMLSGRVPFSGDTIVAVMNKVLNALLPDLSTFCPDVPDGLAQIVQRMLARDKGERYQSMRELAADLERGEPLTMVPSKLRSGAAKPTRAKARPTAAQAAKTQAAGTRTTRGFPWWLLGIAGLGLLAIVAAAGLGGWWLANRPRLTATSTPIVTRPWTPPTTAPGPADGRPTCGPNETELFYDDFENGAADGWAFQDSAGQMAGAWPVVADGANHVLEATGHQWAVRPGGDDIAVQVRVRRITGDAVTHLNVRMGDGTRYWLGYSTAGSLMRDPPADHTLAQFALTNDGAWHTIRLGAAGHHIEVRFDSQVVAEVDDPEGPVSGGLGLENTGGTLWYDDVLVCQLSNLARGSSASTPLAATTTPAPVAGTLGDVLFQDNFDTGPLPSWDFQPRRWETVTLDGRTALASIPANQNSFANLPADKWGDYAVQFDFKFVQPDAHNANYFYLRFRTTDCPPNVSAVDNYVALISTDQSDLRVESCETQQQQPVMQTNQRFAPEGWHTAQVNAVGNHLQVLIDGRVFIDYIDPNATHLKGGVWVFLENNVVLAIDNFTVTEIVAGQAALPQTTPASAIPTLKVGLLLPMSGLQAAFGASSRNGAQMAVDEWNTQGGPLGAPIEPILADGQCNATPAVAAATRLFDQDQVRFLIGEICSNASIPVSDMAERQGVLQISPASTSPKVTLNESGTTKAYVFRASFIDPFQGTVMANFARGQNLQRAFVAYDQNSPYSSGLAQYFVATFEKAGGKVVGQEPYATGTTDFGPLLAKVADSQAQVLFLPDNAQPVTLIAKQARQKGLPVMLLGGDGWESPDLDLAALEGSYYSTSYSPLDPKIPAQDWAARYRARYQQDPDALAALAYDAANLLFTAIQQAGTDDPARVKDVLAALEFEGVTGQFVFDAQHNPIKSAVILQIKDGQRVYAGTVAP